MEQKSIIGCGYVPLDVKAMCLKTKAEAKLGTHTYRIISDPYEGELIKRVRPLFSPLEEYRETRYKAMSVNVLDPRTGLTYAVEYHPANLVRKDAESPRDAEYDPSKKDYAALFKQVQSNAIKLHRIMEANPNSRKDCALLVLFERLDEDGESLSATRLIAGEISIIRSGLMKLASAKSEIGDLLIDVSKEIMLKRILSRL